MKSLLAFIIAFLWLHNTICFSQDKAIDITGNWSEFCAFLPYIQTSEPDVKENEVKTFKQNLKLPAGKYLIELRYNKYLDNNPGQAILQNYGNFKGLRINGSTISVNFIASSNKNDVYSAKYNIELYENVNDINLELSMSATRPVQTLLSGAIDIPHSKKFFGINPGSKKETTAIIHGIPFVASDSLPSTLLSIKHPTPPIYEWNNVINCNDVNADAIHFLGMVQPYDFANGSWDSPKGDNSYSHFVGDTAGIINISFTNGRQLKVPLIFGFNFWYGRPWDMMWFYKVVSLSEELGKNYDSQLFNGEVKYRDIIRNGVKLVDGYRILGGLSNNARYIFSLNLHGEKVRTIKIEGSDNMKGFPVISAITIETGTPTFGLCPLPDISIVETNTNLVTPGVIEHEIYKQGVNDIMHTLYTFVDEHPKLEEPEIPANYFGPKYNFKGTQQALYAASYLYKNGLECGAKIGDTGTGCQSSTARMAIAHYKQGMGIWREETPLFKSMDNWIKLYHERSPGKLGGAGNAWSRGIGELMREAMALGYDKFMGTYTDWLDSCQFTDANPPHWVRSVGEGKSASASVNRHVGDILEQGNRENDGHGICMWGRYMVYHWMGRPVEWNKHHWDATEAAVNWIKWQLNTDTIFPGKRKDVLFTESECALGSYDIYSSYNCLHGLKLSIRMAEQLKKTEKVKEWTDLYNRLQKGILENLVDSSEFGPIWHTEKNCNWQDHAHKLVHLQLATEGDTYTPLQDDAATGGMERKFQDIDINSYRYLMKDKNYDCLRMYGYGQGMMAQSALLLDQMLDATEFINRMVTYAYLPKFEGWSAPEGIIVHKSGNYYLPVNGYMGQDSHLADSQKALRLMLGIDDNKPDHLRIIPRFPAEWKEMSIEDYLVLTGKKRQKCSYSYSRHDDYQTFKLIFNEPVNSFCVRLGPLPDSKKIKRVTNKGKERKFRILSSGDSQWAWIENMNGNECDIKVSFTD